MAFEGNKQTVEQDTSLIEGCGDSSTAKRLTQGEAVETNSESCKQSMHQRQYLETPAERIVRAIRELSDEHSCRCLCCLFSLTSHTAYPPHKGQFM